MSKIPPLRCLFCNHRNPASARYCNACAAELHLQPCKQCGAIDNRTATTCYKCGAQFNVPAAPKRAPPPAAPELAAVPAAPVAESAPAPPILEHQIAKPILNDGGFAIERAFLSESPAPVGAMFRQGLRREVTETQGQAARVADRDPTHLNPDPAHSAVEPQPMDKAVAPESVQNPDLAHSAVDPQPMDQREYESTGGAGGEPHVVRRNGFRILIWRNPTNESPSGPRRWWARLTSGGETVESERAVTATGSRRTRRLALLTLLLAATAASGYYYYGRSAQQLALRPSAEQPAPSMPDGPLSVGATTATVATQVDATSGPKNTTSQPTTGAEEVETAPSAAAQVVAKPRTDPEPVPANRPLDGPAPVSRPAAIPQAAGAALSVRQSSVIDTGVKSRKGPPIFKECTEAVAALGLCSPSKQQGEK